VTLVVQDGVTCSFPSFLSGGSIVIEELSTEIVEPGGVLSAVLSRVRLRLLELILANLESCGPLPLTDSHPNLLFALSELFFIFIQGCMHVLFLLGLLHIALSLVVTISRNDHDHLASR
jgi:hypothetical protein